jgi:ketosteroid isomerase-like protein
MSRENVEVVRQGYAAWNRGDMDAMLAIFDTDFEYVSSGLFPGLAPVYRGHQGWRDFWRDFRGAWETLRIDEDELHAANERVAALFTFSARGRDGLEVKRQFANVWTFREGLVVRIEAYPAWTEALEAVGLRE